MMFSDDAWAATADIRARIDRLPLLLELADGTLDPERFVEYLVQDDFYLSGYARALAMLAARAPSLEAAGFWAASAGGAVAAELEMHGALLAAVAHRGVQGREPLLDALAAASDVATASVTFPGARGWTGAPLGGKVYSGAYRTDERPTMKHDIDDLMRADAEASGEARLTALEAGVWSRIQAKRDRAAAWRRSRRWRGY